MLSNLVITTQSFVLVIDECSEEKISRQFLCQLLREQGQDELTIKTLPLSSALLEEATFEQFLNECKATTSTDGPSTKWNILLPSLADLLCYQRAAVIFQFLHKLRKCAQVKRVFLWASKRHLMHPQSSFVVAGCEYMADLVLHLDTPTTLSIVSRKPGGGVTHKRYSCKRSKNEFLVEPAKSTRMSPIEANVAAKSEQLGTFKIELNEEELMARNTLKLPYEKTSEASEGNIIYTPDADDDFDDEDPDEDLDI